MTIIVNFDLYFSPLIGKYRPINILTIPVPAKVQTIQSILPLVAAIFILTQRKGLTLLLWLRHCMRAFTNYSIMNIDIFAKVKHDRCNLLVS